jgi:hypothetical protein
VAYVEFRVGDDDDEFGILDRRYVPGAADPGLGGGVLYWAVDDVESEFARLLELGAEPVGNTPEEFGAHLRAERELWGKLIRRIGLKLD